MNIKNGARFLLVFLFLAAGTIPVVAHEVSQCDSVEPIRPGDSETDAVSEVLLAHVDITEVETSLSGEELTVVFHLRDLPDTLTFNRSKLGKGTMEYKWEVAIDVDNDPSTGPGGFDKLLSAYHIAFLSNDGTDADKPAPVGHMLEVNVWTIEPEGSHRTTKPSTRLRMFGAADSHIDGASSISTEANTITLVGVIPGITSESRLAFEAYDAGYPHVQDWIECHDSYSRSLSAWSSLSSSPCVADEAVRPGQSVFDDVTDTLPPHVDVTEINTTLSGELLTVVFHFRDVPETFTLDRTGVPKTRAEYSWEVSIDVDGDQDTGFHGFEYVLTTTHYSPVGSRGRDRNAANMADYLLTNTWALNPDGSTYNHIDFLGPGIVEVSAEEDTVTLSGVIPGITAESQLAFGVYDFVGGAEEVGCRTPFGLGWPTSRALTDGSAATPGQSDDDDTNKLVGHIDIIDVTTAQDGETLTATFHLRDVPETLTFDRTGVPGHTLEYNWEVSIDVDNDPETGPNGIDHMLSAGYHVHPLVKDSETEAKITDPGFVTAGILGLDSEGNRVLAKGSIEASATKNTITLSGEIPGLTEESRLHFKAYDYFGGTVSKSSAVPFNTGATTSPCCVEDAAIRPGQRVVARTSYSLPAHVDITEINSTLSGETLTAVFHLRDLPETLNFNKEGVSDNILEYHWEVSIDVDNDPDTGFEGVEYLLSAGRFVPAESSGKTVQMPLSEALRADLWQKESDGAILLNSIKFTVSPEENTITLVGNIPGITPKSRLVFEAYDLVYGSEQIESQFLSTESVSE